MSATTWHVGPGLVERYAEGTLDAAASASVETHLTACGTCRADVARLAPAPDLALLWAGVREEIARPHPPWLVRQLRRVGLPDADAVVLSASRSLRLPWALSVLAAFVSTVVLAALSDRRADLLYLALAPLLPAIGVAAAYDSTDPIREIAETTPASKLRLLLLRTLVVVTCSVPPVLVLGLVVPELSAVAFAWLLPSLSLTLVALVLLRWWPAWVTSTGVFSAWALTVLVVGGRESASRLAALPLQAACAVVAIGAVAILVARFAPSEPGGGTS
ncbi:MAG: hypothetical protein R2737_15670 [Candidatus Nanopelagicales bacterium]